ncbi:hypothetical protein BDF20DRAFT_895728 [Mycotypha africana]|uniref:uncharacterized protein n=1 Tax=Mycotypha africana TaxID=64632 RepID=UPI002300B01F|nr:uncharacterized protein BDF20DRAFT_895728 [Mycotypha africana]KAI8968331.1 hypothetical protein BDF20DRAFT_895728 [Mycotypha africana]
MYYKDDDINRKVIKYYTISSKLQWGTGGGANNKHRLLLLVKCSCSRMCVICSIDSGWVVLIMVREVLLLLLLLLLVQIGLQCRIIISSGRCGCRIRVCGMTDIRPFLLIRCRRGNSIWMWRSLFIVVLLFLIGTGSVVIC